MSRKKIKKDDLHLKKIILITAIISMINQILDIVIKLIDFIKKV